MTFYGRGSKQTVFYTKDIPSTLRPFVDHTWSSGGVTGEDFNSFNTKFKNSIKKMLPAGYELVRWHKMHYEASAFIKTDKGQYVYMSIGDVRFWHNEWVTNILIRTAKNTEDYHGGYNRYTDLVSFTDDIQNLY